MEQVPVLSQSIAAEDMQNWREYEGCETVDRKSQQLVWNILAVDMPNVNHQIILFAVGEQVFACRFIML